MCTAHARPSTPGKRQYTTFYKVNNGRAFIAYYLRSLYFYVTQYIAVIRVRSSMYLVMYKLGVIYTTYIRNFEALAYPACLPESLILLLGDTGI